MSEHILNVFISTDTLAKVMCPLDGPVTGLHSNHDGTEISANVTTCHISQAVGPFTVTDICRILSNSEQDESGSQ